jgi:hypothetical protein
MTQSYRPRAACLLVLALAALGCGGTPTTSGPPPEPEPAAPPKAEVRGDANLNAAEADFGHTQDFTFPVANTGGSPLELKLARKTCSQKGCPGVQVDVPDAPIAPNSHGNVVMHWTPAVGTAGAFTFGADVQTNDPRTKVLRFAVAGRVRPLVRVFIDGREDNAEVDFGEDPIPPGDKRTREVTVFSTALKSFKLDAACDEPGFKIERKPLEPGTSVGEYDGVQSGYRLEIGATKDLPPGYVRTRLALTLSQLGDGQADRTITVPVIAVAGQGVCTISPGAFLFTKQKVSEEDSAQVRLNYINPPGKEDVSVESVEPSFLQVDKPKKELGGGKWVITARLPGNSPEAAKHQSDPPLRGKVVLKVAGLERPLTVPVKWEPSAK